MRSLSSLSSTDVAVVGAAQTRPLAVLLVVLELPTVDITAVGCTVRIPVRSCCAADVSRALYYPGAHTPLPAMLLSSARA